MWAMPCGIRSLSVPEWNLFALGAHGLMLRIEQHLDNEEPEPDHFDFQAFDSLTAEQQIMVLAEVTRALRCEDAPPLVHTAAREAAVASVFAEIAHSVEVEVEGIIFRNDAQMVRKLILAAASRDEHGRRLPKPTSTNLRLWNELIDEISQRIFWDEDYLMGSQFLDLPPDEAEAMHRRFGICREYFVWAPDEPRPQELREARAQLVAVLNGWPMKESV
jgi:hypothetical protein